MSKLTGIVVWEGPSQIDGAPIMLVATGFKASKNEKTGALIQTYILRRDVNPVLAVKQGDDESICGACPHRGSDTVARSCYVRVEQGPLIVFKAYNRGTVYATMTPAEAAHHVAGKGVRLGTYGDPAAVPYHVWDELLEYAGFVTGYTHQWRAFPEFAAWCMASCDTPNDRAAARMLGYRTFRVRLVNEAIEPREVICPASKEAGYKATCAQCKACGGMSAKAKADIVIAAHGVAHKVKAFEALRASIH